MINSDERKSIFILPIVGAVSMLVGVSLAYNLNEIKEQEIEQMIAMKLNTVPESIIVEDQSETSGFLFLNPIKQELKKVYFEGKTYKVQIEKNDVVKVLELGE